MSRSQSTETAKGWSTSQIGWTKLTWIGLEQWAGSRSVARGRSYQRGGRVKDLHVSSDGALLGTVVGGDRYVTTVSVGPGVDHPSLESVCSCPVGSTRCKHAIAVVAEYLQAIADGRNVPVASEDDSRWAALVDLDDEDDGETKYEDGYEDMDDDDDDSWDDDEDESLPARGSRRARKSPTPSPRSAGWDAKIDAHLRAKTHGELADLVCSLARRFPEIQQEFRERISLQEGNVTTLVAQCRREIRKVTSEPAWSNRWDGGGHIPDYSGVRHRFERLLELGHADEVVALGREFLKKGMDQLSESHDEGETVTAFGECAGIVFQAVARSSLPVVERLLFAIDAVSNDEYGMFDDDVDILFDTAAAEDWSAVADALARRLKTVPAGRNSTSDGFSRDYKRDRTTGWIATALEHAGRGDQLRALYESEARATGSYERLVKLLLEKSQFEDAQRWAMEGIAATGAKLPGIAAALAETLCEIARKRKQWDVVAAHAAHTFFSGYPSPATFDEMMKAARKAGVEEPVRAAALRFLETGTIPYHVLPPPRARAKSKVKGKARANAPEMSSPGTIATRGVKIDPLWPLPVPEELIPLMSRPGSYAQAPRPHWDVLLKMAITANRPDEVLRWFDKLNGGPRLASYHGGPLAYAEEVAKAVKATHPERAIAVYEAALNAQLPHAQYSSYEAATRYLKLLRPLYERLGRSSEWDALVASIREKHRNRPRFMELLDGLDGRTIVQAAKPRKK